jgi:hypothetical protein
VRAVYPPGDRLLFGPAWATIALDAKGLHGDEVD